MSNAYQMDIRETLDRFGTDEARGLTLQKAREHLDQFGHNELKRSAGVSPWQILRHNLNNIIVYLLSAAAALSFYMDDVVEGVAVLIALLIAVLTGFFTEYKAQKSVESLQRMISRTAKVIRDGEIEEIDASLIVPGDLLFLEEGDSISADARLIRSKNFACIESALTGESEAVEKSAEARFEEAAALGDQINMVFMGTAVTRGNAYAVVTETGMSTEMGKITDLVAQGKKEKTPLGKEMDRMSKILIFVAFAAGIAVLVAGLLTGDSIDAILHAAIILAVAAIPEAMPAVSTITLSKSMRTMAEHKALVKSLPAVETLGSTSVICTDKTGTLTENQMTVEAIHLADGSAFAVTGIGYEPVGEILENGNAVDASTHGGIEAFIRAAVLSSNATLRKLENDHAIIGDPTEGALVVLGEKTGLGRESLHGRGWQRTGELPFDSAKKFMVTAYGRDGGQAFIKGAPDVLLAMSGQEPGMRERLELANRQLTDQGMRVLAVGVLPDFSGDGSKETLESALDNVAILGLAGIMDPPRQDVRQSIGICQAAGIQVKMITGDHPRTASIIAREIGLNHHEAAMTGPESDRAAADGSLAGKVGGTAVFARVSPENKMQIVSALRAGGETVAMTGDGVNDAPALNSADIGIAMGIRGTEVAKEASDMILTDDRFSTIVEAVREGRIIYANIQKYVYFLFSCNMVEIMTIFLSVVFLLPMPILPLHILFLNLVIDVAPAMALSFEPAEREIMKAPPRDARAGLISRPFLTRILISGGLIGLSAFLVFLFFQRYETDLAAAQTATFAYMAVAQLLHTLNVRKERGFGLWSLFRENKVLLGAVGLSATLQLMAVYLPFFNTVLGTTALSLQAWLIILGVSVLTTTLVHAVKKLVVVK